MEKIFGNILWNISLEKINENNSLENFFGKFLGKKSLEKYIREKLNRLCPPFRVVMLDVYDIIGSTFPGAFVLPMGTMNPWVKKKIENQLCLVHPSVARKRYLETLFGKIFGKNIWKKWKNHLAKFFGKILWRNSLGNLFGKNLW